MASIDPGLEPVHAEKLAPITPGPLAPPGPTTEPFFARLRRALGEEVRSLNFRLLIAGWLVALLPSLTFSRVRTLVYRLAGLQIGPCSLILGRIEFSGSGPLQKRLRIGAHTIINAHFFVDLNGPIDIGDWVSIGHHVTLITADHDQGPAYCRAGPMRSSSISIGDGSWIGAGSTLLPGASIGKSTIVSAGSVVSGKVPDNRMVGGVPARALKALPTEP
jgi:acetyltransferase-like isoleucine patch superfamily enzyme